MRQMHVDDVVAIFASINDRAALITFLAPLRLSKDLSDFDRARVTRALIAAAARCWKGRTRGRAGFEAFDSEERSLGLYPAALAAANAVFAAADGERK